MTICELALGWFVVVWDEVIEDAVVKLGALVRNA
jgi:hypothetical protein